MTTTPAGPTPPQPRIAGDWQPLPNAGAAPHTAPNPLYDPLVQPAGRDYKKWAIRIVLVLVMAAALAVGTWSIYTLLTETFHAPKPIAFFGCGLFDVAALFFALLSQQYATTTDSGLAPRTAMLAMVTTSSWVNWKHAQLENWGTVGGVILAAAPVIAELAFELFHRFEHREALRALGRVAQTLPVLGNWAWITHPLRSRRTLDAHIRAALTEHEAVAERRSEIATERAQIIVSASFPQSAPPLTQPAQHIPAALTGDAQPMPALNPPALTVPVVSALAPASLSAPITIPALTAPSALTPNPTDDAQTPALTERPTPAPSERAQGAPAKDERARTTAQSALSLDARKTLKARQDALTLALYQTLNDRPEWTEVRDALVSAGLESVSRPTAQRIRERVELANPDLPRERRRALTGN
ncbi:DUF2637 domain-containing protein [Streptomyces sp. NBC_01353]|uniref:DUF2637 domain-containing protein n=1 Tax=Streptomyces sp. NBC_01353 TaxID=2903835 RepID=UPI002E325BD3|nr:DUF2637 domain-containing protein [Streptomyces sp. NBC_01353]